MKKRLKSISVCLLTACLTMNMTAFANAATATVFQGDTPNSGDVEAFERELKANNYTVTYKGFRGNYTSSSSPATGSNLNSASRSGNDVIYWSSHGSGTPSLNVINGPSFNTLNYFNPTQSSPLKIAIFGACYQLDGNTNRQSFASKMRNSNVRVIAGYHEQAPSSQDVTCINKYFEAVKDGNSVRYSWEAANAYVGKSGSWITLNYQDTKNEYYRMPGYKNERNSTYPTPTSSTPIYRYWGLSNSAAPVNALANEPYDEIPVKLLETSHSQKVRSDKVSDLMPDSIRQSADGTQRITFREPENHELNNPDLADNTARELLENQFALNDVTEHAIAEESSVMCAEIKPDGTDGEEELIAKRFIYTNNLYGIPIEGNMISVGVDENGVYDIIDTWKDVKPDSATTYGRNQALEYTDAVTAAEEYFSAKEANPGSITESRLIYAQNDANDYELSYALKYTNGAEIYVSLLDLDVTLVRNADI